MYEIIKRGFDIVFSFAMIIVVLIPMIIIALIVTAHDHGRAIYTHQRIGQYGKPIRIWKFRTMYENAENPENIFTPEQMARYRKEFKLENDPRITPVGRILRRTSLDELPQLFNVFLGQMSMVGPRPIVHEELILYTPEEAEKLLSVRPGLTGYWQAYARNHALYETGDRQRMEMYYVDHRGIILDLKILLRTVYAVLSRDGAE